MVVIVACVPVAQSYLTFVTPWIGAGEAPLSMGFSGQEYWSGLPLPPPGYLPNPAIEPMSPALQADSLPLSHLEMLLHNLQGTGQRPAMNPWVAICFSKA